MPAATEVLLQYGALGVLALVSGLAVRVLFIQMREDKHRETERADRNEEQIREMNRVVQERVIPAALEMVNTTKQLIELVAELQAERRRQ